MKKRIGERDFCFYCQDEMADCERVVPLLGKNGYKLIDFHALLCEECNGLSEKFLSDHFGMHIRRES